MSINAALTRRYTLAATLFVFIATSMCENADTFNIVSLGSSSLDVLFSDPRNWTESGVFAFGGRILLAAENAIDLGYPQGTLYSQNWSLSILSNCELKMKGASP